MSGIYDVTLANGASALIPAQGALAKIYSAAYGPVQLRIDGGEAYSLMEGQGVRLPDGKLFRDVTVTNRSGVAQTILVFVGDSRFEDSRITGTVAVVDSNKARTIANAAFSCPASRGAVAAQYSRCGLHNDGTTRRLIVEKITYATTGAAATFFIGIKTANAGLAAFAASKLGGGAASAHGRVTQDNNAVIADVGTLMLQLPGTVGQVKFDTPVVLPPGYGLVVAHSTLNQDVYLTSEFSEEAI